MNTIPMQVRKCRDVRHVQGFARALALWGLALAMLACAALGAFAPPAPAFEKGLSDLRLERTTSAAQRAAIIHEIGPRLKTRWVRLLVDWSALEAKRGTYSPSVVAQLDALVDGLHTANVKVILTTHRMPKWAQNSYWWKHPLPSYAKGPRSFYAIRDGALTDYARLGEFLAKHFRGRVQALECWNEPNLWYYIYPQRTARDANYGARTYLAMLRAFNKGIDRAHTSVRVVAGATSPQGRNDRYRTSPQKFARYLKTHHAASSFDVYSHHPYTPGGTRHPAPNRAPNDTSTTVTLYNLKTLLRLFPGKPFYLTEYGYNTRPSAYFGGFSVTKKIQASYLKTAYSYARRYKQVKLLLWYLVYDVRPASGPAQYGVYTGLRTSAGSRKPAWYAFRAIR
jgi:Cellulase (glycosyl hydrolase family 5)